MNYAGGTRNRRKLDKRGPGVDRASRGGQRNYSLCRGRLGLPRTNEIDEGKQPDFPLTMETRQSKRGRNKK